jgi:hypothetical protein
MSEITVLKHAAGSHVVVVFHGLGGYIDARKDVRHPERSVIEYVSRGQAKFVDNIHNSVAPEYIMRLVRDLLRISK